ncbi:flagellar hook-associated protein 1 FlgK [Alicyclobacillus hesperidum]|uniref:Flagellar hook-associated protein 1 n=1 Tax=Alicyclobacillus hesperidum TaxID=89784 RepID=A0A1H2WJ55_9BACL|nr:flagellar hook-associated protein FlgK [Alicyclobacillus hesperidum]SDW80049.1 flagellar hook-associated protein 1 FlgK [Alicyclobacillus hesperidum]
MGVSTFMPLYVGLSGLESMQQAESVVGNNIDNASTPGYAQEQVNFVENEPFPAVPGSGPAVAGQFGQGVAVGSVTRQDDPYYDEQDRQNQGTYQMYSTHSSVLTQIQGILNEPSSTSVQNAVDQFFSAWQELSNNPSDDAAKQAVITQGQVVGQTFQVVTQQLQQLQSNLTGVVNGQLAQLNQYAQQLAGLNKQITQVKQSGENPNQLLDEQSNILDKMSQLADITYTPDSAGDGGVDVTVGSGSNAVQVVKDDTYSPFPNATTASSLSTSTPVSLSSLQPQLSSITSGQIAGNVQGYDDASNLLSNIGSFLSNFASQVNGALGGQSFFSYSGGVLSVGITSPSALQTGPSGNAGDNTYAVAMVNLQTTSWTINWNYSQQANGGSSVSQSVTGTPDQQLAAMVSGVGTEASGVTFSENTANALQEQSSQLRQSVSGVSLDEQASYMVEFQNAYAAAAKYITTFQSMMQSLLNMVQP